MHVGGCLLVNGRVYDVVAVRDSTGDIAVRDILTNDVTWIDWFTVRAVDPHSNPGAVLEVLAGLDPTERVNEERRPIPMNALRIP